MEGIGLDNMMGAAEVERFFSSSPDEEKDTPQTSEEETSEDTKNNETKETAEVDFSDFLSNKPESVGSGENTEGNGDAPESNNDTGTPQQNLFSTIAKALRDEGVFPDLSDDTLKNIKDAATLRQMFVDENTKMLDERHQRLEKALEGGASTDELREYQNALNLTQFLESKDTYSTLLKEGSDGEDLRKKVMYQDYVNRGFSHERAVKMVQKSLDEGEDIEDAKEAFESCKQHYKQIVDDFQSEIEDRNQKKKADEEKQFSSLKKRILDTETFYDGVSVARDVRQKAYDYITKPVYKDDQGNYLNELQKYQREDPMGFMENVALMYALTDGFKNVEKLTRKKVQAGIKKGFEEVASVLNSTRRNGDGTLNLANAAPDDSDRENWTLA